MLDRLRQECEVYLASAVREDSVEFLAEIADRTNSPQLMSVCTHFLRNARHTTYARLRTSTRTGQAAGSSTSHKASAAAAAAEAGGQ